VLKVILLIYFVFVYLFNLIYNLDDEKVAHYWGLDDAPEGFLRACKCLEGSWGAYRGHMIAI